MVISMEVGDSFLFNEYESSIIHRSCAKMPRWILEESQSDVAFYNLCGLGLFGLVGLGLHFAIFLKQRQFETRQIVPDYSVIYNTSAVKITNKTKQPSNCTPWRFRRSVISPFGSFSSFLASAVYNLLMTYIVLSITPSGPSVFSELHLFSVHSVYFFCFNLIESICSPTLRNSLIDVMPWSRDKYRVAVIV